VKALSESPKGCQLEYLNLECTMANDSSKVQMKKRLAEKFILLLQSPSTKLRELDLSNNKLGDDFVTIFVNGLKHNVRLEELYLYNNDITSVGAKALATVLYYNRTLTHLYLKNNSIGDDGAISISTALRYHPKMEYLDSRGNFMTDGGILEMIQFLKYKDSVTTCYCTNSYRNGLINSIEGYNDTLCRLYPCGRVSSPPRDAPKKGSVRRQHMFTWMASDWINLFIEENVASEENTVDHRTKKRKKNPVRQIVE
jgi:Leucine Rich repeat